MISVEQIDHDWVQDLPMVEQVRLISKILQRLNSTLQNESLKDTTNITKPHSIMELCGLGAELWREIDAQAYVDQMRNEWECPTL